MEGCGAVSGLPDDPLVEILSRVPAKSVCRFKCVSKAWRDLIAHPDHRKKLRQPMQGLFVEKDEFSNDRLDRVNFSFIDLTVRNVPLDIDPSFSFLKELTGIKTFYFLDSCNGLILFTHRQQPSYQLAGYIVCNPTTKQWLALAVPLCGSREPLTHTYLAFDPDKSSHFHLVQFQMPMVHEMIVSLHVYSSETLTWSQNQLDEETKQGQLEGWHHQFTLDPGHCTFVNGFLHTIVWGSDAQQILAIDVKGKERRMIAVPGMADGTSMEGRVCYFGQSQGHIHFMSSDKTWDQLSIWILQDYDKQEWVLKHTVDCMDIFGERGFIVHFEVVDIHKDCNVVFFFHQHRYELIAYNMDRKEVSVIATFEDNKFRFKSDFAHYIPYYKESPALTCKH